jgi:uncharacterized membrane protein YdjX (TVP38/TMEM64 family)
MVFDTLCLVSSSESKQGDDPGGPASHRRATLATIAIVAVFAALAFLIARTFDEQDLLELVDQLRRYGRHWWAPAALIVAMTVINLTGIPGTPLTLAAGVVWGWLGGGAWMMVATMIGTALPYYLTRKGMPRIREKVEARFGRTVDWIQGSGFTSVTILRMVHIFPFALVSYASGLAGVRARDYFAGTFAGTLPGVFIYTYLADSIIQGMISAEDAKQRIIVAALLLTAFVVATNVVAWRIRRHQEGGV